MKITEVQVLLNPKNGERYINCRDIVMWLKINTSQVIADGKKDGHNFTGEAIRGYIESEITKHLWADRDRVKIIDMDMSDPNTRASYFAGMEQDDKSDS